MLEGIRGVGEGVEIGVFTQDLAQDLPTHLSGLEFVLQVLLHLPFSTHLISRIKNHKPTFTNNNVVLGISGGWL